MMAFICVVPFTNFNAPCIEKKARFVSYNDCGLFPLKYSSLVASNIEGAKILLTTLPHPILTKD